MQKINTTQNCQRNCHILSFSGDYLSFLNDKNFPIILRLYHNDNFVTNFKKKAEFFNCVFAQQCSIIQNNSKLLTSFVTLSDEFLSSITFSQDGIFKIIQRLDPSKSHGPEKLRVRVIKLWGISLCNPWEIIFKSCFTKGAFSFEWKKPDMLPSIRKAKNNP